MQSMNISSKYLTGLQDGFPTSSSIFEAEIRNVIMNAGQVMH